MRLRSVLVEGFHGLTHVEVELSNETTVLIGESRVGKSTMLETLERCLGPGRNPDAPFGAAKKDGDGNPVVDGSFGTIPNPQAMYANLLVAGEPNSYPGDDPAIPVFTAEPGLYAPDLKAGIRLEQNYLVTASGVELLTKFPLEL